MFLSSHAADRHGCFVPAVAPSSPIRPKKTFVSGFSRIRTTTVSASASSASAIPQRRNSGNSWDGQDGRSMTVVLRSYEAASARRNRRSSTSCLMSARLFSSGGLSNAGCLFDLPDPFIGWVTGDNSGDQCELGPDNEHTRLAKEWCERLEEKHPEIAKLGTVLITAQDTVDLWDYLYPHGTQGNLLPLLLEEEWNRRAVASWYAILKH